MSPPVRKGGGKGGRAPGDGTDGERVIFPTPPTTPPPPPRTGCSPARSPVNDASCQPPPCAFAGDRGTPA